jgi:hypothetical protein
LAVGGTDEVMVVNFPGLENFFISYNKYENIPFGTSKPANNATLDNLYIFIPFLWFSCASNEA